MRAHIVQDREKCYVAERTMESQAFPGRVHTPNEIVDEAKRDECIQIPECSKCSFKNKRLVSVEKEQANLCFHLVVLWIYSQKGACKLDTITGYILSQVLPRRVNQHHKEVWCATGAVDTILHYSH